VARRATIINNLRESSAGAVVLLDAGGTLFGQELAAASQGQVIIEAMNAMAYDALTVGQLDLLQGLEVLQQRATEAHFPLLSCNLVDAQDGKPIFEPYVIVERNGTRFGILGVSEPELGSLPALANLAQTLDPVDSVKQYLPEVRAQSDVVIVLSHLGIEADKALAQAVPGIQIIIGGKSRQVLAAPERSGDTLITQPGFDGEWLGQLDLAFDERYRVIDPQMTMIALVPEVESEPAMVALVDSHRR